MKKILLGTTALVAVTAITAGVAQAEVGVSAGMYQQFGAALESDGNYGEDEGLQSYSENAVIFSGSSTAENGMTFGFKVDLSANVAGTIDEGTISISDDWGTLVIGNDDGASDIMNMGTPAASWMLANSGTFSHLVNGTNYGEGAQNMGTTGQLMGDSAGIRYYSPSMNGLTLGLSYRNGSDASVSSGDTTMNDLFDAAVNYSGDMGDSSVYFGAGVEHASHLNNEGAGGDDTANLFHAEAGVGFGSFTVGAAWGATDYKTTTTAKVDNRTYAVGVSYNAGASTVSVDFIDSESEIDSTSGTTEGNNLTVGYGYDLGGGAALDAAVSFIDVEGRTAGSSDDVDATVFAMGLGVSF